MTKESFDVRSEGWWVLFGLAAVWLVPQAASAQDEPQFAEARARFEQGLALADAGNCSGAIAEFHASMEILPRPSTLFNIARCHETENRYDLAVATYEQYLALAATDDPDRATVQATMRQLRGLLGTIHVRSNVPAEVWLGDRVVGAAPGAVLVPGGRHVIELRAEGRLPVRREVEVSAHTEVTIEVDLTSAAHTTQVNVEVAPLPIAVTLSLMGASVASLGVGVYFGVNAITLSDQERARDDRLPRDASAIEQSALFADIFFIAGGVLGAATLALAFLTQWDDTSADDTGDESEGRVRVIPLLGPLFAGVRVEGFQ